MSKYEDLLDIVGSLKDTVTEQGETIEALREQVALLCELADTNTPPAIAYNSPDTEELEAA